jgi:hypothetical protein
VSFLPVKVTYASSPQSSHAVQAACVCSSSALNCFGGHGMHTRSASADAARDWNSPGPHNARCDPHVAALASVEKRPSEQLLHSRSFQSVGALVWYSPGVHSLQLPHCVPHLYRSHCHIQEEVGRKDKKIVSFACGGADTKITT